MDSFQQAQSLKTCPGQHDGVVVSLVQLTQARINITANRFYANIAAKVP